MEVCDSLTRDCVNPRGDFGDTERQASCLVPTAPELSLLLRQSLFEADVPGLRI